jgi:hypothetical protein
VVVLVVDDAACEAVAEEVAVTAVTRVEPSRVASVQELHALRELLPRRLDEEVVVRAHEAESVDLPTETFEGRE